ncbi:MAG: hypothetical protein KAR20_03590, partial [Candidatus Heimdallarchaeota archaeon]|nr:hypothetical protein [Candidatus Heimdallarchaeota archaeon]
MSDELVIIKKADIPSVFKKGGSKSILDKLKEELDKFEPDLTTAKGRAAIASFAYKFSQSKTYLEGHRKALVEKEKERLSIIDTEGKKIRETCDQYRDKARKPLTDWEDAEKERVAAHEMAIHSIEAYIDIDIENSEHAKKLLDEVKAWTVGDFFEEFE